MYCFPHLWRKQNTGQNFLGPWEASETLYLFSSTKQIQVGILEEVKVIFKPSICLLGFIWWLLRVEMTTHATSIPSGRKFSHSSSCPSITFPEAHQPLSVMSANCVSLSSLGAPLVLHASTCSGQRAVAMASRIHHIGCGIRSSPDYLLF